jgi:hypothetical protein
MPKPTIFSISIKGLNRLLFSIQERTSGDLTLIVKHSLFSTAEEGGPSTELDTVIEERYSAHLSIESSRINAIKYTRILKDGRQITTRNYTEAIKLNNCFTGIFMRRTGDLSGDRYTFHKAKGTIVSLGSYDQMYFQPVYFVLLGPRYREFVAPSATKVNVTQRQFKMFTVIVLWQFLAFTGETASRTLIPKKTFTQDEISAASPSERQSMEAMSIGFMETGALDILDRLKRCFADTLVDASWNRMANEEKLQLARLYSSFKRVDIFTQSGIAFSPEHHKLLLLLSQFSGNSLS